MVSIIAGAKGKGKTKIIIQNANDNIKLTNGTIVYLDKNNKHMYELSNRIRLIVVPDYEISTTDMFLGFIAGIISQDHDLQQVYFDSFLKIANIDGNFEYALNALLDMSKKFDVDFIISASVDKADLPEFAQELVTVAL